MTRAEGEGLAKRVIHFYLAEGNFVQNATSHHFNLDGKGRPTIYPIVTRFEEQRQVGCRPARGGPKSQVP